MDKMREGFSKHCQLWRYSEEVDENDFFVNATTQRAWDVWVTAWQASRAALVVELPIQCETTLYQGDFEDGYESGYNECLKDAKENLLKAGIKCN